MSIDKFLDKVRKIINVWSENETRTKENIYLHI